MSTIKPFDYSVKKIMLSVAAGLACMGSAVAGDKIVPIKATANSPGNVRTDTCARPEYPVHALKPGQGGEVALRFLIGTDGVVKQSLVHTSSGYPALDEAALMAISKCRFNPPMVDGKPVAGWTAILYVWP